jgi:hypothetical protein
MYTKMNRGSRPPKSGPGVIPEWQNALSYCIETVGGARNTTHSTSRTALGSFYSYVGHPHFFICNFCRESFCQFDIVQVHLLTRHSEKFEDQRTTTIPNPKRIESPQIDEQEIWEVSHVSKDIDSEEARREIPPFVGEFSHNVISFNTDNVKLGTFNGIQGENNSCYLDASLMAMFYMNNTFDSLLSTGRDTTVLTMNEDIWYCKAYLTRHIVNSLRQRGFVEAPFVMEWRRMIEPFFHGGVDFSNCCERHEACDFVRFLIETIGVQDYRSVSFGIESTKYDASNGDAQVMTEVMVQLLPPPNAERLTLSASHLLSYFQESQGLGFRDFNNSLILQLPRNGSKHRPVRAFVPDPILRVYQHHGDSDEGSNKKVTRKVYFELRAVIVIETGHFVTYIRVPESGMKRIHSTDDDGDGRVGNIRWLYADSMSDRQFGHNVPLLVDVTEEVGVLEYPNAIDIITDQQPIGGPSSAQSHLKRITSDASMLFYSRVSHPKQRRPHEASHQTGNSTMMEKNGVDERKSNTNSQQYPCWPYL